jgi:hypothetical protein
MTEAELSTLIQRMDETRARTEAVLERVEPDREIYPQWRLQDMLAHLTGWDEVTIDCLQAHAAGRPLARPAIHSLDAYNASTVGARKDAGYEQVLAEWRQTRKKLRSLIAQMPVELFKQPVRVPWGESAPVTALLEMFREHEEEHLTDILQWLQQPDQPLTKKGN